MMKNYLVTFSTAEFPEKLSQVSDILAASFDYWAAEPDDGLFFVSSDKSAEEIFGEITASVQLELPNTLYVFQLGQAWAGFGTTKVRNAISKRLSSV